MLPRGPRRTGGARGRAGRGDTTASTDLREMDARRSNTHFRSSRRVASWRDWRENMCGFICQLGLCTRTVVETLALGAAEGVGGVVVELEMQSTPPPAPTRERAPPLLQQSPHAASREVWVWFYERGGDARTVARGRHERIGVQGREGSPRLRARPPWRRLRSPLVRVRAWRQHGRQKVYRRRGLAKEGNHSSPQTNEFLRKTKEKPPSFISQWRDACKSYLSPGCLQPNRTKVGPAVVQQAMDPAGQNRRKAGTIAAGLNRSFNRSWLRISAKAQGTDTPRNVASSSPRPRLSPHATPPLAPTSAAASFPRRRRSLSPAGCALVRTWASHCNTAASRAPRPRANWVGAQSTGQTATSLLDCSAAAQCNGGRR